MSTAWSSSHKWVVRNGDTADTTALRELGQYLQYDGVNVRTESGCTLGHFAALTSKYDVLLPFLVSNGLNINANDADGTTPLHWATRNSSGNAVHLLLLLGASTLVYDKHLRTPLHYAAEAGNLTAVTEILKDSPQLLEAKDAHGNTPLQVATKEKHLKVIRFLVRKGSPVKEGIIRTAIRSDSSRCLRTLLESTDKRWSNKEKEEFLSDACSHKKSLNVLESVWGMSPTMDLISSPAV